eukprot:GEMP01053105.1.p1 GENE.GEMP01053105.1~~GEMP01053105.1.p1  ORF type:complete len:273 (+),score=50.01 GEMP01053105.1:180-998(+)
MMTGRRRDSHHVDYLYPCYAGGCMVAWLAYRNFADCGFSTLLTLSGGIQFFAFLALVLNVYQRKSVAGLSENMILLEACEFGFRLSSTMWLRGYLPADATGAWMYQFCDIATLCCTVLILRAVKLFGTEEEADRDGWFPMWQTILGCLVAAIIIHPDLNDRPFFDIMWTTSLYINVISMLPQLFVLHKCRDEVDALTVHFIAAITLSRLINMVFWCYAFEELKPEEGINSPGFAVVGAHCLQLMVMADFIYYYFQALLFRSKFYRDGGLLGR